MKKYEIKKMVEDCKIGETFQVYTGSYPRTCNSIERTTKGFEVQSSGQNWSDQAATLWTEKQLISFLWTNRIKLSDIV